MLEQSDLSRVLPQAKLLAAMSLYSMQARGPASEKLAEVLAAECLAYWQVLRHCQLSIAAQNILDLAPFVGREANVRGTLPDWKPLHSTQAHCARHQGGNWGKGCSNLKYKV